MSKIFSAIKVFLAAVIGILVGVFLFLLAGQFVFKGFYQPFVVLSGSMRPAVDVGSVVVVHPSQNYAKGDIITFSPDGNSKELVTHRITSVGLDANGVVYKTKGDANEEEDLWLIPQNQVLGKTRFVLPYLGYAVDFAQTPQGLIIFIVIPATIVVYEELKNVKKEFISEIRKLRKKKLVYSPSFARPYLAILIPVVGVLLIAGFVITSAYYIDQEQNKGNTLGASSVFPSPSPSISPSPLP